MLGYTQGFCANSTGCKNITELGAQQPTRVRKGRTICSRCEKVASGFKSLVTAPKMVVTEGKENRGRKPLDMDDNLKRERSLQQRAIASAKSRRKLKLLKELGSEENPEWKKRWHEVEAGIERTKAKTWGKDLKQENKQPKTNSGGRKAIERVTTANGYSYAVFPTSSDESFDLEIKKIDQFTGAKSDIFTMKNLTYTALKGAIKQLVEKGISSLQVTHPYSAYTAKAIEFKKRWSEGALSQATIEDLREKLTFGFLIALYLEDPINKGTTSKTNLPALRSVYRMVGDAKISTSPGPLQAQFSEWMSVLAASPIARSTRMGEKGGAKSTSTLAHYFHRLTKIAKTLEEYKSIFPHAHGIVAFVKDRTRTYRNKSIQEGNTQHKQGYRPLRLSEITEIFKAPTTHHGALVALALSTGVRPDELPKLTSDNWDKESGQLLFNEGRLLSKKLAKNDPKYLANPTTSTVVKFILTNSDLFDPKMVGEVNEWMTRPTRSSNRKAMKGSHVLQRIAKYTKKPIATKRDFRKTCATMLSWCGTPRETAQHRLGHTSQLTTEKHYIQNVPDDGGAYIDILDPVERGDAYFQNPEVVWFNLKGEEKTYKDENAWDTFLLVQFLQLVLDLKERECIKAGLSAADAQRTKNDYYSFVLIPKLERAISHVATAKEVRKDRLPSQRFNPLAGTSVSTPHVDIPMPVQLTPSKVEA